MLPKRRVGIYWLPHPLRKCRGTHRGLRARPHVRTPAAAARAPTHCTLALQQRSKAMRPACQRCAQQTHGYSRTHHIAPPGRDCENEKVTGCPSLLVDRVRAPSVPPLADDSVRRYRANRRPCYHHEHAFSGMPRGADMLQNTGVSLRKRPSGGPGNRLIRCDVGSAQ